MPKAISLEECAELSTVIIALMVIATVEWMLLSALDNITDNSQKLLLTAMEAQKRAKKTTRNKEVELCVDDSVKIRVNNNVVSETAFDFLSMKPRCVAFNKGGTIDKREVFTLKNGEKQRRISIAKNGIIVLLQ